MTRPIIDPRAFETLQANTGADFVLTLIEAFASEAPRLLAALKLAAEQGDAAGFEDAAHTLKSNGVTFGATRLADMAHQLEWTGHRADSTVVDALAHELDASLLALRELAQS